MTLPATPPRQAEAPARPQRLTTAAVGRLLGALASRPGPLPKYRYPSAGTLYPVQAYVSIHRPIGELAAGSYYYDPNAHELARLSDATLPLPDGTQPAVLLLLVAQHAAIVPIYAEHANAFCLLEAGYMTEALRHEAAACGLVLRDGGDPDGGITGHARALLQFEASHAPLVCLALEG